MNKKAICALTLIAFSLALFVIAPAESQPQNILVINADGTITPTTALIEQESDTYTLMGDLQTSILIQRSNITLDGAGRLIQGGNVKLLDVIGVSVSNLTISGGTRYGIILENARECRVANCTITDVWSFLGLNGISFDGIYVSGGNSNIFTQNTLVNNSLAMHFESTTNNTVTENYFSYVKHGVDSSVTGVLFNNADGNKIYHNNFQTQYGATAQAFNSNCTWDNGFPDGGNFWGDYGSYHPNASEIGDSGLWSEPYEIIVGNADNYPLQEPFNATAYAESHPTPTAPATPSGNQNITDTAFLAALSTVGVVLVAVLAVLLIRSRKKR